MSSNTRSTSSSTFQSSHSFSSVTVNGRTTSYSESMYSDPSGTKVRRTSQEAGQEMREVRLEYDAQGRKLEGGQGMEQRRRIEDVTEQEREKEREREYEERMEEEYAKREGGA